MAWDDPVVWVLIIAVVVFLFGANKIPEQQYFLEKNLFPWLVTACTQIMVKQSGACWTALNQQIEIPTL